MALRLINSEERLKFEGDGFNIFYRRLPNAKRGRIMEQNSKRGGDVNFNKATIQMLEYSITGWSGFYTEDASGNREEIPYDVTKVALIPDEVQAELMDLIGANADRGEVEAKNFPSTSASSTTTEVSPAQSAE